VFVGTDLIPPRIVDDTDIEIEQIYSDDIIEVPEEHRVDFDVDVHLALQDLAGVATGASYKLFKLKDRLNKAFVVAPIFPDTIQLDFDEVSDPISYHLLSPKYFDNPIHPDKPRAIHIDIGLSGDRLGIAATILTGFENVQIRDPKTLESVTEMVPKTMTEWAVGIEPKGGHQIPIDKVKMFLLWLQNKGYNIYMVTCDGYQSAYFLQVMEAHGFKTDIVSVDRTSLPYMTLRNRIYRGMHSLPKSELLKKEMNALEVIDKGEKVDHPIKGSKDVADAICGSHFVMNRDAHKLKLLVYDAPEMTASEKLAESLWGIDIS
jgi:hypothetical protein